MEIIAHRVNTLEQLSVLPITSGAEVDLRDSGSRIILQHDPFKGGEDFEAFLANYRHGTLILNVKSERIEHKALELLQHYGITRFFFLDSSIPMCVLLSGAGETRLALRFSEFEGLDTIMKMKGRAQWVWVDCFTQLPLNRESYLAIKGAGYKLCLVSPELQGRPENIENYRNLVEANNFIFDAVCSKQAYINRWI